MKLHELLGRRNVLADVGIEIEVEGEGLLHESIDNWTYKEDGSLRGESAEYVLHRPKPIAQVPALMDELIEALQDAEIEWSYRCSTHVHVNCLDMQHEEILAFIYGYLLLEEPLMTYCGRERKGNRFCLRLQDAEGLLKTLDIMYSKDFDYLRQFDSDVNRYASINIDALQKFGSLEFRGMRGTIDKEIVVIWCNTLVHLRDYCRFLGNPLAVHDRFIELGAAGFLSEALGQYAKHFRYPRFVSDVQRSFSLSIELPQTYKRAKNKPKKEFIALKSWAMQDFNIPVMPQEDFE